MKLPKNAEDGDRVRASDGGLEVLSVPDKRAKYDAMLGPAADSASPAAAARPAAPVDPRVAAKREAALAELKTVKRQTAHAELQKSTTASARTTRRLASASQKKRARAGLPP